MLFRLLITSVLTVSLLLLVRPAGSAGGPGPITAQGVAGVTEGGLDIARDAALHDALRHVVEMAVGTMVESDTLVKNLQLVSDNIYTKTRGYVKGYRIIDEGREQSLYKVKIEATVDIGNLEKDLGALGILYQRMKKPRIMVIVLDRSAGSALHDSAGEAEIAKQFLQKGMKVVDQAQVKKIREGDQIGKALQGDVAAARLLGHAHGAEVLVVGETSSDGAVRGGMLGNMVSVRARMEARAIRADTGEVLVAESAVSPGLDISEQAAGQKAVVAAARQWAEAALPIILDRWNQEVGGANSVQLMVSGLSLDQLVKFKEVLTSQVRGVTDVQQRSFVANVATLDLDLKGSAESLAEELAFKKLGPFKVEVTGYSANRLDLRVLQK